MSLDIRIRFSLDLGVVPAMQDCSGRFSTEESLGLLVFLSQKQLSAVQAVTLEAAFSTSRTPPTATKI